VRSSLSKDLALLGGIVVFCATMLVGLVQRRPPLAAMGNAALCAVGITLVLRIALAVGRSVMLAGLRQKEPEEES
jgi:hypothetical protein